MLKVRSTQSCAVLTPILSDVGASTGIELWI